MESAQGTLRCPVLCRCFHLVSRRSKAVDSQALQQRNASPLVSQINVYSGRAIEPTSLEMMARARATATCPSDVTAFTLLPEDINLPPLWRDFSSNPSPEYPLLFVSASKKRFSLTSQYLTIRIALHTPSAPLGQHVSIRGFSDVPGPANYSPAPPRKLSLRFANSRPGSEG